MDRRQLLTTISSTAALTLAGCAGQSEELTTDGYNPGIYQSDEDILVERNPQEDPQELFERYMSAWAAGDINERISYINNANTYPNDEEFILEGRRPIAEVTNVESFLVSGEDIPQPALREVITHWGLEGNLADELAEILSETETRQYELDVEVDWLIDEEEAEQFPLHEAITLGQTPLINRVEGGWLMV